MVDNAAKRLWTPEGDGGLQYLRARGLADETIRFAGLGWTNGAVIPKRDGSGSWTARGITIPWTDGDRLVLVKIRQPEGRSPKYGEAFRDRPRLYPGPEAIEPGKPLIVTEGEFDALLLGQALGSLAAVMTLGGAGSTRPDPDVLVMTLVASARYLATDSDSAGEKAAANWSAAWQRIKPPHPFKDWTEAHQAGVDLRRWWIEEAFPLDGPFTDEERKAIQEADGVCFPDKP
jgi:hypothetical protein